MFTIQHSHWRRGHSPTPATHVHTHTRAARLNARHASLPPPPYHKYADSPPTPGGVSSRATAKRDSSSAHDCTPTIRHNGHAFNKSTLILHTNVFIYLNPLSPRSILLSTKHLVLRSGSWGERHQHGHAEETSLYSVHLLSSGFLLHRYASKVFVVVSVNTVACSRMQTSCVRCCLSFSFVAPSRARKPITKAS